MMPSLYYAIIAMVAICHVNVITVRITQTNEEKILVEPSEVKRRWNDIIMQLSNTIHHLSCPQKCPIKTGGAQNYKLNELNGHFSGKAYRLRV